mgnify:CR=1 FL=1
MEAKVYLLEHFAHHTTIIPTVLTVLIHFQFHFHFQRGFNPFLVNSVHTFGSQNLEEAVADFLRQETVNNNEIKDYLTASSAIAGAGKAGKTVD